MKTKSPLVSVIMPAYNSEKTIARAIESILNQSYKNFEFIIINDGSTDKTLEIIKQYAKKDKRIKLINNGKNLGIPKTRNIGIKNSNGKYIAVQDSDDFSFKNRFEKQIKFLEENLDVGVIGSFMEILDKKSGKIIGVRKYPKEDNLLRKMIFFVCPIAHPTAIIRTEVLKKSRYYNNKYTQTEDLDLLFRLGENSKMSNIQEILVRYGFDKSSSTGKKTRAMEKFANEIRWRNKNNPHYSFGLLACIYNIFHTLSIYLIPSKIKFYLFTKLRDK